MIEREREREREQQGGRKEEREGEHQVIGGTSPVPHCQHTYNDLISKMTHNLYGSVSGFND